MHSGYVFAQGPEHRRIAVAKKGSGEEYYFDAVTGEPIELDYNIFGLRPIDLNGDGIHEFLAQYGTKAFDAKGNLVKYIGGNVMTVGKWYDFKGEQFLVNYPLQGIVRMWGDVDAEDSDILLARYKTKFKYSMKKMTGSGYNLLVNVDAAD